MLISSIYKTTKFKELDKLKLMPVVTKVEDVTEDYKKSLLTKKPVEVKSRFPNTDTKIWEPQPKQVCIGKGADGVKVYQYVSARGNNDNV
tara:strand:- start:23 stop:292 length:270 start_codon:yes stop_codon:yes gene_type:complete